MLGGERGWAAQSPALQGAQAARAGSPRRVLAPGPLGGAMWAWAFPGGLSDRAVLGSPRNFRQEQ